MVDITIFSSCCHVVSQQLSLLIVVFYSQVKEAMQRIHDRGNIGKLILDVEKTPTPLVTETFFGVFLVNDRN